MSLVLNISILIPIDESLKNKGVLSRKIKIALNLRVPLCKFPTPFQS